MADQKRPTRTTSPAPREKKEEKKDDRGFQVDVYPGPVSLDANTVVRKQTRPIGEFGGNIGGGFWTVFVPLCIWYFYGCAILDQGSLHMPSV